MIEQTLKMFFNRIDNYMFKFTLFQIQVAKELGAAPKI